ncbi:hypothetical protein L228DRAFT_98886 [Xylona heveae TC161]|uniref:Leucine-rich repeat domain-containing protein n=1 Tax=Xylona heveae (strain CBS 132557 / TC161) TaxID=1328760 RepID=A0A165I8M7_XYLHT|nr:hypothetical protein L228DRAFT_98886 [Xylona heveae TC161]KZF24543.1 hypothetical protein L228DRAFT_98886 [Xylona heveae TC161]
MARFEDLPVEIVREIILWVPYYQSYSRKNGFGSLRSVSKTFQHVIEPIYYSTFTCSSYRLVPGFVTLLRTFWERPELGHHVKRLHILEMKPELVFEEDISQQQDEEPYKSSYLKEADTMFTDMVKSLNLPDNEKQWIEILMEGCREDSKGALYRKDDFIKVFDALLALLLTRMPKLESITLELYRMWGYRWSRFEQAALTQMILSESRNKSSQSSIPRFEDLKALQVIALEDREKSMSKICPLLATPNIEVLTLEGASDYFDGNWWEKLHDGGYPFLSALMLDFCDLKIEGVKGLIGLCPRLQHFVYEVDETPFDEVGSEICIKASEIRESLESREKMIKTLRISYSSLLDEYGEDYEEENDSGVIEDLTIGSLRHWSKLETLHIEQPCLVRFDNA